MSSSARGSRSVVPAAGVRRLLPARPRRLEASSPIRRRPGAARRALRHLRLQAACDATGTPSTISRGGGIRSRRSSGWQPPASSTLAGSECADEPVPAGISDGPWQKMREQAELQLSARETWHRNWRVLPPQPGTGFALLPEPRRRRPVLRLRGQPVLGLERRARVSLGDPRRRAPTSRRSMPTITRASSSHSRPSSTSSTSVSSATRTARLPLRAVRDHRTQAPDGPVRHA